jgi:hypothetical protein
MIDYPQETIDKAAALLPVNLRYLLLEIELYLDLTGPEFVYTNELSTIWHRVGECQVQAYASNNPDAAALIADIEVVLENLRSDFRVARFELKDMSKRLADYIVDMDHTPRANISVGDYKEK